MPRRALGAWRLVVGAVITTALVCSVAVGQRDAANSPAAPADNSGCLGCHSEPQAGHQAVRAGALAASPHRALPCQSCHATITATPHTTDMTRSKAACAPCHPDQAAAYASSVHARPNKQPGDHPTCAFCHGGGDPHAVRAESAWKRADKVRLCSQCHQQASRMARYGPRSEAVPSYLESFHGRALVRFGMTKAAICTDCHRSHDVLAPSDPRAPTSRGNAAATCGQTGCHIGPTVNFAMSGANHLRLKLQGSPALSLILLFFRTLLSVTAVMLVGAVGLDLRLKVLSRSSKPACGRPAALLIAAGHFCLVVGLIMAAAGYRGDRWAFLATAVAIVLAYIVYRLSPEARRPRPTPGERTYQRLTPALRWQHILMFTCFTLLASTGIPLRFAHISYLETFYLAIGGLPIARIVHRVAAVGLVGAWVWHMGWLLVRWKQAGWSLKSWTMLPNWRDVKDFLVVLELYLGIGKREPKYGRFQFKEKADYFAEYWGMPVMVITGLILWFPVYFGNRLPEIGLSVAIIAHGFEATLAFIAIVTWHMYNAHFDPDCFPGRRVWYTGTLTREEMEIEHPLELEQIEAADGSKKKRKEGEASPAS